ncbi:RHS repeat domain-containing protein [Chryseobacterium metallicongregator]|uniref:RHS repeat domain-containing protein n=1 Tax=Chryseobacterium metallicongregator TaxID=3073042 RepID=UPI003CC59F64
MQWLLLSIIEKPLYLQYKDHLGNTRLSYADTNGDGFIQPRRYYTSICTGKFCIDDWKPGEIVEVNNYYPFGMLHNYTMTTQNAYQYKYNGKELQESGMYDYGARMYMPDLGRWGVIDPLAETSRRWSTYAYAYDNPVMFIDPDGMQNVSALHWKFDQNSTILGSSWFGSSYESAGFGNNFKTMWNGGDHGGSSRAMQGPKPGFWKSIGNAIRWLFGGNNNKIKLEVGPAERIPEDYSASGSRLFGLIQGANYNHMAEYRARRDNPFYNEGESSLDRSFRLMNSSHIEIMQDFGGGGYNMFGGYGRLAKAANAVAAAEETGNGISKILSSIDEFDPLVTLYRGTSGSEVGSEFLFLTDNVEYAASYIKNGGTINQYQISRSGLYILEHTQRLSISPGQHMGISGTFNEYLFTGKDLVEALNKLGISHIP